MIRISTFLFKIQPFCDDEFAQAMTLICESERRRVNRYKSGEMRSQALFVRAKLRQTLSDYCRDNGLQPVKPREWRFEAGDFGKPRLSETQFERTGIQFNLSHSGEYLFIGILHSELDYSEILLGVDIERDRAKTDIHAVLNRYFSEREVKALLALPAEKQRQGFFDLWALKESYIKATGRGLAAKLDSFCFAFSADKDGNQEVELTPEPLHRDKKWFTFFSRPVENYRIAVSVTSETSSLFSASVTDFSERER